jgi:hypothetical protein
MAMGKRAKDQDLAGREVYYGGWGGYGVPRVPQEPIAEAEALARDSYYVARYDGDGRLVNFQKFLHGERDWADEYAYWDNGKVKERVMRKADGSQDVQRFDARGRIQR